MMSYTVNSDRFALKAKGESVTDKELLEAGCNVQALVAGGHLVSAQTTKAVPTQEGDTK
jgi:hypothetical protein